MSKAAGALDQLRDQILAAPEMVLADADMMKALANASDQSIGENVVDLRGMAMDRLEQRFDRLEDTHRNVLAAAYDNLAGTRQIHRAVLAMMEPLDFTEFLQSLTGEIASILKVDAIRLCLESPVSGNETQRGLTREYGEAIGFYEVGSVDEYLTEGRNIVARQVTMRQVSRASETLYGDKAPWVRSEGLLRLDLGNGNLPGMLAMASEDPHMFNPNQGNDLLTFFGNAFERTMRRWLD